MNTSAESTELAELDAPALPLRFWLPLLRFAGAPPPSLLPFAPSPALPCRSSRRKASSSSSLRKRSQARPAKSRRRARRAPTGRGRPPSRTSLDATARFPAASASKTGRELSVGQTASPRPAGLSSPSPLALGRSRSLAASSEMCAQPAGDLARHMASTRAGGPSRAATHKSLAETRCPPASSSRPALSVQRITCASGQPQGKRMATETATSSSTPRLGVLPSSNPSLYRTSNPRATLRPRLLPGSSHDSSATESHALRCSFHVSRADEAWSTTASITSSPPESPTTRLECALVQGHASAHAATMLLASCDDLSSLSASSSLALPACAIRTDGNDAKRAQNGEGAPVRVPLHEATSCAERLLLAT